MGSPILSYVLHTHIEDLTSFETLKIDNFKVFGYKDFKKNIEDLDVSRRDLFISIFKIFAAALEAEILATK